nr:hypothetical protein Iba_chr06aCG13970 [Ipomoea batatas]
MGINPCVRTSRTNVPLSSLEPPPTSRTDAPFSSLGLLLISRITRGRSFMPFAVTPALELGAGGFLQLGEFKDGDRLVQSEVSPNKPP